MAVSVLVTNTTARLTAAGDDLPTFPLLAYDKYSFATKQDIDDLGIAWTSLLRSGWFDDLVLCDSTGRTFRVARIEKLGGVGPFWGWNPLYGRRIALDVHTKRTEVQYPFAKVKDHILALLKQRSEWRSRDDYVSLVRIVEDTTSISHLIDGLCQHGI